jgi:hypothetical protein
MLTIMPARPADGRPPGRAGAYAAVVTVRLACDDPQTLRAATIGAARLAVAERILADGAASRCDGLPVPGSQGA